MTLTPEAAALTVSSALSTVMICASAAFGAQVLRSWDLNSGSERQLNLERRTYLVSTMLAYAFFFQCVSLFFLVHTAERMHPLFVGAMCAVGTFSASRFGFSALVIQTVTFVLAAIWLIMNHADNHASDYPLIRPKYALLLLLAPISLAGTAGLIGFFWTLSPQVITSCCGALFGESSSSGVAASLGGLPPGPMMAAFYFSIALVVLTAIFVARTDRGHAALGIFSLAALLISLSAIISFVSCYVMELPTHHCPFCILQKDYYYIGYPMYLTLFGGAAAGMGAGVLGFFKSIPSLADRRFRRALAFWTMALFLAFAAIVTWEILGTDFKLFG